MEQCRSAGPLGWLLTGQLCATRQSEREGTETLGDTTALRALALPAFSSVQSGGVTKQSGCCVGLLLQPVNKVTATAMTRSGGVTNEAEL